MTAVFPFVSTSASLVVAALLGCGCLAAADIAPELPADPGQPGPTGTVRLLVGPEFLTIAEHMQTTSATTVPVDSSARSHSEAGWRAALQAISLVDPERDTGWCYGGELDGGRIGWSRGGVTIALRHLNLDALFGYSGRIIGGLRWDVTPFAGMGVARWQVSDPDQNIPTTRALYLEAGLRAGLSWTWNFGLQAAIEARAIGARTSAWTAREDDSGAASTVHDHARLFGGAVLGGLGWRF